MRVESLVSIVVVPHERFSYAGRSLESIYERTQFPFTLVYVDAGSPSRTRAYLEAKARQKGFRLIRTDHYLSPNQARNLGVRQVSSEYIVFIENDVLVEPGWLDALVRCAEETGAWLVGPLYLIGSPEHRIIHMAGGSVHIQEERGKRILYERKRFPDTPLDDAPVPLQRERCGLVEFHCMLARTEVFQRLGPLDEGLLSVREHQDFCLAVQEAGGPIFVEPNAVVTMVPPPPLAWSDFPYYMLRWSDAWAASSLRHFHEKWNLDEERHEPHTAWTGRRYRFLTQFRVLQRMKELVIGRRQAPLLRPAFLFIMESVLTPMLQMQREARRKRSVKRSRQSGYSS